MTILAEHRNLLDSLSQRGRLRRLEPRAGADFASNDYLGLAASALIRELTADALARHIPPGAGAARLLRGNHDCFEALEEEAAAHFGAKRALYFGSGYAANLGVFSALPRSRDLVLHDDLIHASSRDGIRLGAAGSQGFAHNDPEAARSVLKSWRAAGGRGTVWIAIESLYSMDGDFAPMAEFTALAQDEGAFLIVDEAHATGVWGPQGRGLAADIAGRDNVVTIHTCSKALGLQGALVCGPTELIDVLTNKARSFVYSTAPSPLLAEVLRGVLAHLAVTPDRRLALRARIRQMSEVAQRLGLPTSGSQILPIRIPGEARCLAAAASLQAQGYDIRAIRAPTVPKGTERLRLSITLSPEDATVEAALRAVASVLNGPVP